MNALANASDRITIEDRGKTFEDRPLLLLTITSPENHQNIDAIRTAHIEATEQIILIQKTDLLLFIKDFQFMVMNQVVLTLLY